MSARLCQDCCQWVWSKSGRCPDCESVLSESLDVDAVAERVRNMAGVVHGPLGHIRISRRQLPADGMLFETHQGLFFLPHRTVTAERLIEEHQSAIGWRIAAACWAPLLFVLPFLKQRRLTLKVVNELEPIHLTEDRLHLLPELLPRVPGALFFSTRDIVELRRSRSHWTLERTNGAVLRFEALAPEAFAQRLGKLLLTDKWQTVMGSP